MKASERGSRGSPALYAKNSKEQERFEAPSVGRFGRFSHLIVNLSRLATVCLYPVRIIFSVYCLIYAHHSVSQDGLASVMNPRHQLEESHPQRIVEITPPSNGQSQWVDPSGYFLANLHSPLPQGIFTVFVFFDTFSLSSRIFWDC